MCLHPWLRSILHHPLFLTRLDELMRCVLGQHDETGNKEHAIYYLSKRFTGCEQRYFVLE